MSIPTQATYPNLEPDAFLKRWLILGPFPVAMESGLSGFASLEAAFNGDLLEARGGEAAVDPEAVSADGPQWHAFESETDAVDLGTIIGTYENTVAYAWARIDSSEAMDAALGIGSDDAVKIWLNGEPVHANFAFRPVQPDQDLVPIRLREGANRLLIKILNGRGGWGFACRVLGPESAARVRSRRLIHALGGGDAAAIRSMLDGLEAAPLEVWSMEAMRETSALWPNPALAPALRLRLDSLAERLSALRTPDAIHLAARLQLANRRWDRAIAACEAALNAMSANTPDSPETASLRYLRQEILWRAGQKAGTPPVDAFVEAERARRRAQGISIAVLQNGRTVIAKGYGMANVELSVPASPETIYELASVTKQFTAAAILLLVADGKIALSDAISKHVGDLPEAWGAITVEQLLNHTSGIKSYTSVPEFWKEPRKDYTPRDVLRFVDELPLEFEPGSKHDYNNSGYVLLGMIVEAASGRRYGAFLEERIFRPLGMDATRVNSFRDLIPNRASGYSVEDGVLKNTEYLSPTQPFSAGALVSSVLDLAKWDAALYTEAVLKRDALDRSWTPTALIDGSKVDYGYGWEVHHHGGRRHVGHGGGIFGFSTYIARFPEDGLTVIALANFDRTDAGAFTFGIADLLLPVPRAIEDEDPETTASLRAVIDDLARGLIDPARFTPEGYSVLSHELNETAQFYRKSGPLNAFDLIEARTDGQKAVRRYLAVFGDSRWIQTFDLDESGRTDGIGIAPE